MDKNLDMGNTFYDSVKKKSVEKKTIDLESFMEETTIKKMLIFFFKLIIIPLIAALILSILLEGGFLTIFIVILVAILVWHILVFVKARSELQI